MAHGHRVRGHGERGDAQWQEFEVGFAHMVPPGARERQRIIGGRQVHGERHIPLRVVTRDLGFEDRQSLIPRKPLDLSDGGYVMIGESWVKEGDLFGIEQGDEKVVYLVRPLLAEVPEQVTPPLPSSPRVPS
jgi:hypothetical protein